MDSTALIVNYRTPRLTHAAVWSLRSQYPALPVMLIDNASPAAERAQLKETAEQAGGVELLLNDENAHHGPALHQGMMRCPTPSALLFDSDCIAFRPGFLELMQQELANGAYICGAVQQVDAFGYNVPASADSIPYAHPSCALLDVETYKQLPPFEKHGAPCITNQKAAFEQGFRAAHFDVPQYVYHIGRGTVNATGGYHLGTKGYLNKLRRLIGK
ncbi:MAG: glycosyltransferase family 2 protein [Cyclonatronaceae bacterium]